MMKTLNDYFDKIYVINLKRRTDRKDGYFVKDDNDQDVWVKGFVEELETVCSEYEIFEAVDGNDLDIEIPVVAGKRWNKGAYALTLTTIKIIDDAIEKGYKNIFIFEDDLEVHPLLDINIFEYMERQPINWDMLFLGYTETGPTYQYNTRWRFLNSAFSCQAYGINSHVFKLYKRLLSKLDNPIDYYTNWILATRTNSYGAMPMNNLKLVSQKSGYSDLEGGYYDTSFTK